MHNPFNILHISLIFHVRMCFIFTNLNSRIFLYQPFFSLVTSKKKELGPHNRTRDEAWKQTNDSFAILQHLPCYSALPQLMLTWQEFC